MMRSTLTCHVTGHLEGCNRATAIRVYPVAPWALPLVLILLTGLLIHCCKYNTQLSRNLQCACQSIPRQDHSSKDHWDHKLLLLYNRTTQIPESQIPVHCKCFRINHKSGYFVAYMCALTGMAGCSSVSSATTIAGEHIPCLRTIAPMLTGVRNTPAMTHTQVALMHAFKQQQKNVIFR